MVINRQEEPSIRLVKGGAEVSAPTEPESPAPLETILSKADDDKIASLMLQDPEFAGKLKFFHGSFHLYEHGVWHLMRGYEARRKVRIKLREYRQFGVNVNQQRIKALTSMLEDDLYIPDYEVMGKQEEQRQYINLKNGLFNLTTMQFEEGHNPDLLLTTQLDFDYNPDAECPTFMRYLQTSLVHPDSEEADWSLITLLMEALAYSMTARTDMKASFWLVGRKDSGKSTLVALLKSLMGNLHATVDLNQLGINRFLLSGIVGKRVVSFTESDSNAVLPDALYKTLVGGTDEIYADVKNRDPICFRPECKVWWAMNDGQMPRIADRSGATMRRIHIIPFNRTVPEKQRIANLEGQLRQERSGIFNKLILYLNRLTNGGYFEPCKQSQERLKEYIMENDTEATFIEDCYERHQGSKIRGSALYERYTQWCNANGFRPKNSNQVAKEWRRLGFEQKSSAGSWWIGLKPRPMEPEF